MEEDEEIADSDDEKPSGGKPQKKGANFDDTDNSDDEMAGNDADAAGERVCCST